MHPLDYAIIQTLCYADIFDYPLTDSEVHTRLISPHKTSLIQTKIHLQSLLAEQKISQTKSLYHLPNRKQLVTKRHTRERISLQKIQTAQSIAAKLAQVPFIEAIFLTGAVAVHNATQKDDLDILILSSPNSVWTCRFFTTMWLELHGMRRRPKDTITPNKVCANVILALNYLATPKKLRNLYTAHEVVQIKALYDPHHYEENFRHVNQWVTSYLPNVHIPSISRKTKHIINESPAYIESIAHHLQLRYMSSKRTRETITPNTAYFHPRDTSQYVLAQLAKRLKQYS